MSQPRPMTLGTFVGEHRECPGLYSTDGGMAFACDDCEQTWTSDVGPEMPACERVGEMAPGRWLHAPFVRQKGVNCLPARDEPLRSADPQGRNLVCDLTWDEALTWLFEAIAQAAEIEDARRCIWCVPFGVSAWDTIVDDALDAIVPRWPR